MTIEDSVQSSTFLLPSPQTFYQAKILCKHWQLRSLICSPSPDTVYYPTGNSIYVLNTETRKREQIASLPFSPRCLGAKHGWVCAGGVNNGHFASLKVGESGKRRLGTTHDSAHMEINPSDELAPVTGNRPEVKISELGGLIVNSVTLHRPPESDNDDDVLAILTNNDKTVRIFSLSRNQVVSTLHLNIATNHASISSDGKHLVVVGDSTKVYFYHPVKIQSAAETNGPRDMGDNTWTLSSNTPLTAGAKEPLISTGFSPCSRFCAVASQEGSITIFDTYYLQGGPSLAIVRKIESTRPRTNAGAIRSVQFSPAPWDLLIWAEHSGRVTIADVRSDFVKRQTVDVLIDDAKAVHPEEWETNHGVSSMRDEANNTIHSRRTSSSSREEEEFEQAVAATAMTGQAESYLHSHRGVDHSQEERISTVVSRDSSLVPSASSTPVTYLQPSHPNYRSFSINQTAPVTHISVATTGSTSMGPPPLSPTATSILRDYRERHSERDRWRERGHEPPRRRNSVYLPNDLTFPPAPISPAFHQSTSSHSRWMERPDYEAQPEPPRESEYVNPLFRNEVANVNPRLRTRTYLNLLVAEERRRNEFRRSLHDLRRHDASSDADDDDYTFLNGGRSEDDGISITGCTLSFDGGKLYVATKKGIVEYSVNLAARRFFPVLAPR